MSYKITSRVKIDAACYVTPSGYHLIWVQSRSMGHKSYWILIRIERFQIRLAIKENMIDY